MLIKYIAYSLIVWGSLVTLISIYVVFVVVGWLDILIGLVFFGPVPLIIGLYILRYIKTKINLTVTSKFK